ncbi:hypothetical protein FH972_025746 [Carpinus fangiana]|uniref:Metallo-beta-lactamase domain-containing protein n=1 Tax=Carpinus fangiana TaxID=176857 RepID=A0A5N6L264_9ROSI|nr:hypothetical protein FH972_025746 [Carpinus fangiana]
MYSHVISSPKTMTLPGLPKATSPLATCTVRIISPNRVLGVPASAFLTPDITGSTTYSDTPCLSFLIEHVPELEASKSPRRILFDLGISKDLTMLHPSIQQAVVDMGISIDTPRDMVEILSDDRIRAENIESVIFSHHHFDHIGNLSLFPVSTTSLVVGPGFKKNFTPGFPVREDNISIPQSTIEGRVIDEVNFANTDNLARPVKEIGGLKAVDWFGDGSLWLLDTPGHAIGHISALVRTTAATSSVERDTWVLLTGDVCHHAGELRPSVHHQLPQQCLGCLAIHPKDCTNQPFYDPAPGPWHLDVDTLKDTTALMQAFDADPDVFVILSHDHWLEGIVDLFPHSANQWKAKGWDDKVRWRFLKDFEGIIEGRGSQ